MNHEAAAEFTVHIFSTEHATWQGEAETCGSKIRFESELQLLRWMNEQLPGSSPRSAPEAPMMKKTKITIENEHCIEEGGEKK